MRCPYARFDFAYPVQGKLRARQKGTTLTGDQSVEYFNFAHKIFQVPRNRFALSASDHQPVLLADVGEHEAAIAFDALRREFNLDPEGADSKLLDLVAEGLKYVRTFAQAILFPGTAGRVGELVRRR